MGSQVTPETYPTFPVDHDPALYHGHHFPALFESIPVTVTTAPKQHHLTARMVLPVIGGKAAVCRLMMIVFDISDPRVLLSNRTASNLSSLSSVMLPMSAVACTMLFVTNP